MEKMDSIRRAVDEYAHIKKCEYVLTLSGGKDKRVETVKIDFADEDLFHILGLHHLSDIDIPRKKGELFNHIITGRINDEYLSKSEYYDNESLEYNIRKRIEAVISLEEYFDSDDFRVSVYRLQHENKTYIIADYLITCKRHGTDEEFYIFLRKRKEADYYGIISCFPKNHVTYWGGKRYLMLKEKYKDGDRQELFRHPNYSVPDDKKT